MTAATVTTLVGQATTSKIAAVAKARIYKVFNLRNKDESNVQELLTLTISNCLVLPMTIIPKY